MLRLPALVLLLSLVGTAAQATGGQKTVPARAGGEPVIGCTALANLRSLLRDTKGDTAAALTVIRDPKSDLGCNPVDRAAVTEITDHVSIGGRAYDCLALKGTAVCHWVVAGAIVPPEKPAGKPKR